MILAIKSSETYGSRTRICRWAVTRSIHRAQHRKAPALAVVETASLEHYDTHFGLTPAAPSLVATSWAQNRSRAQIEYYARAMRAPRISDAFRRLGDQARDAGWSHEEYLAAMLSRDVSEREASGAALRIKAARFPGFKTLEDFNFDHQPFAGHRVLFYTAVGWVARLQHAHSHGKLDGELKRLRRYSVLIVDEVGYIPFDQDAANLFFQLVSSRYEQASLILTSNLPFSRWGDVFGDPTVA
ncbi:DNA replication protein DnaC [Glaciihabitans tibetensis]|uniref:DNA replication protein DnaC n=1 Tax=Glaciihabitans tibetensis TaxID=1266600 RepID=A0A2T0VGQ7_9MICO|nr:DNA replication protein DnaC [Glaciihabitans tibetensis]